MLIHEDISFYYCKYYHDIYFNCYNLEFFKFLICHSRIKSISLLLLLLLLLLFYDGHYFVTYIKINHEKINIYR